MKLIQANLRAVLANANVASVDIRVVTCVFQAPEMHELLEALVPAEATLPAQNDEGQQMSERARIRR